MRDFLEGLDEPSACAAMGGSRALVVVPQPDVLPTKPDPRASASFVTQLLACEERLAPFRRRRRAEPGAALSLYSTGPALAAGASRVVRVL